MVYIVTTPDGEKHNMMADTAAEAIEWSAIMREEEHGQEDFDDFTAVEGMILLTAEEVAAL